MNKSRKFLPLIMCVIAVVSVCLNAYLVMTRNDAASTSLPALNNANTVYRLYVVIPSDVKDTDDYIHRLEGILSDRMPGFTMYPTRGGGRQSDGSMKYQTTLVCEMYGTDDETVTQISREVMAAFGLDDVPVATSLAEWEIIK